MRSTFGLYPNQLAGLLAAGETGESDHDQSPAHLAASQLLRRRLAEPLQIDDGCVDSLSAILDRPCEELQPLAGRVLGDILLDPTTPLEALETLKQYGKGLADLWEGGSEHFVAITIYFAAIATALVSHRRKITGRSYRDLADSMRMLMNDQWITPELAGLFDSARIVCEASER